MTSKTITPPKTVFIGNALVDFLAYIEDDLLDQLNVKKGSMSLVESHVADTILQKVALNKISPGGSSANSAFSLSSLGCPVFFVGKTGRDYVGDKFRSGMQNLNITHVTEPIDNIPSGQCLILVSPDGERTMLTYLGASEHLTPDDIHEAHIKDAAFLYLEGYLFDRPLAQQAFLKAANIAKQNHVRVVMTLSDPFCVNRHRRAFFDLIQSHVDILFANEDEIMALFQTNDIDEAIQQAKDICPLCFFTMSAQGSVVVSQKEKHHIKTYDLGDIIDTTGAGDQYAAGALYALLKDYDLHTAGHIASLLAAEVITHIGAKPEHNLNELIQKHLSLLNA